MTFSEIGTGVVLLAALLSLVWLTRRGRSGFQPTQQVVSDAAGRRLRLYVDRQTGEQQWREEPGPSGASAERPEDSDSSS